MATEQGNTQTMEEFITSLTPSVEKISKVYRHKVRDHAIDADDLAQSALLKIWARQENYMNRRRSRRNCAIRGINNTMACIMKASYNGPNVHAISDEMYSVLPDSKAEEGSFSEILECLTSAQRQYVVFLLDPPTEYVKATEGMSFRQSLRVLRDWVGMSRREERQLRQSIVKDVLSLQG